MNVLEINHLKKEFDGLTVLQDISLSVREGEVVSVIGPSGSGKSTLLRCATMLEHMDGGELIYMGEKAAWEERDYCVYASKEKLKHVRRHFGLVFQSFNLFPQYTALENVTLARQLLAKEDPQFKGNKKRILEEIDAQGRALLEQMGLADRAGHYPHQLSGGQQQRVAIARALALSPDILCFDEPTSALDPELTGEVLKVIRTLAQRRTTMVIVTHEMAFARDVADQVIFMDGGVIVEQGDARQVIEHPQEERTRQFLSRYAEN